MVSAGSLLGQFAAEHPGAVASNVGLALVYPIETLLNPLLFGKFVQSVQDQDTSAISRSLVFIAITNAMTFVASTLETGAQNDLKILMEHTVTENVFETVHADPTESVVKIKKLANSMSQLVLLWRRRILPNWISILFQSGVVYRRDRVLGGIVFMVFVFTLVGALTAPVVLEGVSMDLEEGEYKYQCDSFARKSSSGTKTTLANLHRENRRRHRRITTSAQQFQTIFYTLVVLCMLMFLRRMSKLTGVVRQTEFLTVLLQVMNAVLAVGSTVPDLARYKNQLDQCIEFLNLHSHPEYVRRSARPTIKLILKEVCSGPIRDFSRVFRPGLYVLTSPIGSGKTTLLKIMAGLKRPVSGEVSYHHSEGSKNIAYLSVPGKDLIVPFHRWWNRPFPEPPYSAGEYQLLCLTTLLEEAERADLVLLDEPERFLDDRSVQLLRRALFELSRKKIVVLASHEPFYKLNSGVQKISW